MLVCVIIAVAAAAAAATPLGNDIRQRGQNTAIIFPNSTRTNIPTRTTNGGAPYSKAIKAINYGAARILKMALQPNHENWLVSPVSMASMLGQLMLGARGHLRRTLAHILTPGNDWNEGRLGLDVHKELGELLNYLQDMQWTDYTLYIAGALFVQPNIDLTCSYKHALGDIYNLNIVKTDFLNFPNESMTKINAWSDEATCGKIKEVLNVPPAPSTGAIYLNSAYFKGTWKAPFDPTLTKPGKFMVNETFQVPVEYMAGEMEVKYLADDSCACKMIGVPYEGSTIFLYVFMPDKNEAGSHYRLYDLAADLSPDRMYELITAAQLHNVTVTLPKVTLATTLGLHTPLVQAIRKSMKDGRGANHIRGARSPAEDAIFSNSMSPDSLPLKFDELSGKEDTFNMGSASEDSRFRINELYHKVQLEMNESGVEAAAVTSTLVDYFGTMLFRVDRPFLFIIRHEPTGVHLFWGAIYNPANLLNNPV